MAALLASWRSRHRIEGPVRRWETHRLVGEALLEGFVDVDVRVLTALHRELGPRPTTLVVAQRNDFIFGPSRRGVQQIAATLRSQEVLVAAAVPDLPTMAVTEDAPVPVRPRLTHRLWRGGNLLRLRERYLYEFALLMDCIVASSNMRDLGKAGLTMEDCLHAALGEDAQRATEAMAERGCHWPCRQTLSRGRVRFDLA
ncbi:MAG: hypothetical protein NXI07_15200, partial [bacterium]|nr:hypothetical protein [bacterium]